MTQLSLDATLPRASPSNVQNKHFACFLPLCHTWRNRACSSLKIKKKLYIPQNTPPCDVYVKKNNSCNESHQWTI